MRGFLEQPEGALIENCHSRFMLASLGELNLPITIEDGREGGTYVASPHSAYVLYARDEIDILQLGGASRLAARATLRVLESVLRALSINNSVHIDNWMLSTSLHGHWSGQGLSAIREAITRAFPDHLPIIRNVDDWSCPELFASLKSDGWYLMPARQIWVTDDLDADWRPRSHVKSDKRAARRAGLTIEELEVMRDSDAVRIAELYRQLYLDRYSSLNPVYTPAFVKLAHDSGALKFIVGRSQDGEIMVSSGMRIAGDTLTVPMLGYDTTRPQSEALYRIASLLSSEWALDHSYRHHGSAGAGTFKSNRGARSQIEYMAVYAQHLGMRRRLGIKLLANTLERTMVPALRQNGW
ncbi:MAG: hypothetical protein AAFP79_10115 [Pseudomonadota bacterium]